MIIDDKLIYEVFEHARMTESFLNDKTVKVIFDLFKETSDQKAFTSEQRSKLFRKRENH